MTIQRVLVIKLADFGDALLATPALRALRTTYPGARLDVLTTPPSELVFRHSGLVDRVWVLEARAGTQRRSVRPNPALVAATIRTLRSQAYDAVALFHHLTGRIGSLRHAGMTLAVGAPVRAGIVVPGSNRGWFLTHRRPDPGFDGGHEVVANLAVAAALGARTAGERLAFDAGAAATAAARRLLVPLGGARPVVAVHAGCGPYSPARRWSPEAFARVVDAVVDSGARVILLGTRADDSSAVAGLARRPVLDLTAKTDLPTLAAVLAAVEVLVTNDGGVMHLATAVGTPVVAVFGPSNPTAWGPWSPGTPRGKPMPRRRRGALVTPAGPHRVVALDVPCRPCLYVGHRLGARDGCATRDCLAWLDPVVVVAEVRKLIGCRDRRGA